MNLRFVCICILAFRRVSWVNELPILFQKEIVTSRLVTSMPPIGSLDTTVRRSYGYIGRFSAATSPLFSKISLLLLEIGECDNDVVVGEPAGAWKKQVS